MSRRRDESTRPLAGAPSGTAADVPDLMRRELAALWREFRPISLERLAAIRALVAASALASEPAARERACREAHKLVGSLGTFGLHRESDLARAVESLLQTFRSSAAEVAELDALLVDLRLRLDRDLGDAGTGVARLIAVGIPSSHLEALAEAGRGRGVDVVAAGAANLDASLSALDVGTAVLLALPAGAPGGEVLRLATERAAVPLLMLAHDDSLATRLEAARHGAVAFLTGHATADQIIDTALQALQQDSAIEATILAVDDDPTILAALRHLLSRRATRLHTLDDPSRFWETLEATNPDLLVLDIDMPGISGIDLCRVVRGDPRWLRTPVLFLTARSDPQTLTAVFGAGADDYVNKPIVGPELVTRITNRLERTYLLRQLAETDSLTGVTSRRKSVETLQNLLQLAGRQGQPMTLAIIDLDYFKRVNDRHGHAVGDAVLARLGQVLLRSFRGEDVVARWGGEEFVVGMYGLGAAGAVRRVGEILAAFRHERFDDEQGGEFGVTFSAGVAEFVTDAHDLQRLYRAADAALYRAKAAGRNWVEPASRAQPSRPPA